MYAPSAVCHIQLSPCLAPPDTIRKCFASAGGLLRSATPVCLAAAEVITTAIVITDPMSFFIAAIVQLLGRPILQNRIGKRDPNEM
jgi:hypothetical protein